MLRLVPLILLLALMQVIAQDAPKAKLVDEFDPRSGCETLERRMDYLFALISSTAGSKGYIVIRQGNNPVDNAVVVRSATNYPQFRGFPADKLALIPTSGSDDIWVQFWLGRDGQEPAIKSSAVDLVLRSTARRHRLRFADDTIELVTIDGRRTYIGAGNASCLYHFDDSLIWEFLAANGRYDAEFKIKAPSMKRYREAVRILRREFVNNGAPAKRIRFVFGGIDKNIYKSGAVVVTTLVSRASR